MPAYAIIGGQWGDEGKGKVVDFLAERAHFVVRFGGGTNAGHTVMNDHGEFRFHTVPSGMFRPGTTCVIGGGAVVDPEVLFQEIDGLRSHGVDVGRLAISERAHVIMPYHIALDHLEERSRGSGALGTTGRGIGPGYMDKAARWGVRVGDLLEPEVLRSRLEGVLAQKNALITGVYGGNPFDVDEMYDSHTRWGEAIAPFVRPTEALLHEALERGEVVLLEGAQGALLDLDYGTYPYVTSSSSTVGGAVAGSGVPAHAIAGTAGVFKAYTTRVGSGPMPSEIGDSVGDTIRERAWEYGTTTGRPRRCGWFDAVAARYSVRLNGFTSGVLTRLDVLDGLDPVRICVGYRLDGRPLERFPSGVPALERCEPVYEDLQGWQAPTAGLRSLEALPPRARAYVSRVSELIGCPIDLISTGPRRQETIVVRNPL